MIHITLGNTALCFLCNKSSECSDGFIGNMTTTVSTKPMTKDIIKGKMYFDISLKDTTEDGKKDGATLDDFYMKKLTRKEKKKLIDQGTCWKCGKTTIKQDNNSIYCTNCGLKIIKY